MNNFGIQFDYPWLLLLLIPAIGLTLLPYFKLSKKYRKTRNRITSIVLHVIIMTLAIFALSGSAITYNKDLVENEIIFVVDMSDSHAEKAEERNSFLRTAIEVARHDNFKLGVVTFGFDQVLAVPLTRDGTTVYDRFLNARLPDQTATNIAGALTFAYSQLENPETSKLVLITDGFETDNVASNVIGSIAKQGTRVDVARINSGFSGNDIQLIGAVFPNYSVRPDEECDISLIFKSNGENTVTFEMLDNGFSDSEQGTKADLKFDSGTHTIGFKHTFAKGGMHEIKFVATISGTEKVKQNNVYCVNYQLNIFNKLLILHKDIGETQALIDMLKADDAYDISTADLKVPVPDGHVNQDGEPKLVEIPKTVDEMREYDQIIMNNVGRYDIANKDNQRVPENYDKMLQRYVNEFGGSILTVGGDSDEKDEAGNYKAHAYNHDDLRGSELQNMLPITAENYVPPLGLVVIIDRSGSMDKETDGVTKLQWAKTGTNAVLGEMNERDMMGIIAFSDSYEVIMPLTSIARSTEINMGVNSIPADAIGSTEIAGPIAKAGEMLIQNDMVDRRHIILITDGAVEETARKDYEPKIQENIGNNITMSVISIGLTRSAEYDESYTSVDQIGDTKGDGFKRMWRAAVLGGGKIYSPASPTELTSALNKDLQIPAIKEVTHQNFNPVMNRSMSPLFNGVGRLEIQKGDGDDTVTINKMDVQLGGFYGSRIKSSADMILAADFQVPLYAQWKYGKGMVGSFLSSLNGGAWSADFMAEGSGGRRFITNVINNLMPLEDIHPKGIAAKIETTNYTSNISIYTRPYEGEYITGRIYNINVEGDTGISLSEITAPDANGSLGDIYVTIPLALSNNYTRCEFVIRATGAYRIVLQKYNTAGDLLSEYSQRSEFSYSAEYDTFIYEEAAEGQLSRDEQAYAMLAKLAIDGGGVFIENLSNPMQIIGGFSSGTLDEYSLTRIFIITAIILFLLDVAVRKFKFKWPHEIFRAMQEKRKENK